MSEHNHLNLENRLSLSRVDAFDLLANWPRCTLDLIVTDIPYESLEKHRKRGTTTRLKQSKASSNQWFGTIPNERLPELFELFYRALAKNRHLYFFCDQETMFHAVPAAEAAGFKFWKPLVWDKVAIGMGYHYRARYELILFFEKGKRKLNDLGVPDILTSKRLRGKGVYPTQKPVDVLETLIRQSTEPGMLVMDPFMGSGTAGVACLTTGRRFIGADISQAAFDAAAARATATSRALQSAEDAGEPIKTGIDRKLFWPGA